MARLRESEPADDRGAVVWAAQRRLRLREIVERFSPNAASDAHTDAALALLTEAERTLVQRSVYDEDRRPARDELERRYGPEPREARGDRPGPGRVAWFVGVGVNVRGRGDPWVPLAATKATRAC
jgi:hypothetical protein